MLSCKGDGICGKERQSQAFQKLVYFSARLLVFLNFNGF